MTTGRPRRLQLVMAERKLDGGGSGIRTHVGVTQTCFQDMRLKPLGHPSKLEDFTITGRESLLAVGYQGCVASPPACRVTNNGYRDSNSDVLGIICCL